MTRIATMAAAALTMLAAACGGGGGAGGSGGSGGGGGTGGGGGAPLGLDRNKAISTVTEAEKGALCDWYAPMAGGYGAPPVCATGFIHAPPDRATCIADFPSCTVTIGEFQDCIMAILAAQAMCTQAALTEAQTRPEGVAVGAAACF